MLKALRITLAAIVLALVTFFFLDFTGILPTQFHAMEMLQFVPAVMAGAVLWLAVLVLITWLAGRVYCSVLCPMGILQDIFSWVSRITSKKRRRYKYSKPHTWLRIGVLVAAAVCLAAGFTVVVSVLDPYSAFGRIAAGLLKPVYLAGNNVLAAISAKTGSYAFYREPVFIASVSSFVVAVGTLLTVGYMSWKKGRLYCNTICPVGTILGAVSKYSLIKVRIDKDKCVKCGACAAKCKSSCIDFKNKEVDNSRCVDCYNCLGTCKYDALHYSAPKLKKGKAADTKEDAPANQSRRRFIATSAAVVAAAPALYAQGDAKRIWQDKGYQRINPISPPGSLSHRHLREKCTACHLCIAKCPSKVLKPAFLEYGAAGMMQPMMYFDRGFCNYDCTICSDVCPNGALQHIPREEKHMTQVGRVVFRREACVVVTSGTSCGACSEHCPTQAVTMVPFEGALTIPKTDPDICVGCGGCEFICPVRPLRAIYVEGNVEHLRREEFNDGPRQEIIIDDFGF